MAVGHMTANNPKARIVFCNVAHAFVSVRPAEFVRLTQTVGGPGLSSAEADLNDTLTVRIPVVLTALRSTCSQDGMLASHYRSAGFFRND